MTTRWYCHECGEYSSTVGYEIIATGWDDAYGMRQRTREQHNICAFCGGYDVEEVHVCETCKDAHAIPGFDYCHQHMPPEDDLIHELAKDVTPEQIRQMCLEKKV